MIQQSLKEQLNNLQSLLKVLDDEQYTYKSTMLNNGTIGQHVRHIVELVQCLMFAYEQGIVDYDRRKRDARIETIRTFALYQLDVLQQALDKPEKKLRLQITTENNTYIVETGYNREVFYNTEHAIHHMALIRVALKEMRLNLVSDNFGMAYATIQYKHKAGSL
jgi:uncharacterized damage-inducible protein DinB